MYKVETVDDLWNHIAYVLLYAPDSFPFRDFLPENGQMDLDKAFVLLRNGVEVAYPEPSYSDKRALLNEILDRSYSSYIKGKEIDAGHLLNEFQANIFKAD